VNTLDVARWQFGITTVYHFIFVPLTIGLSVLVAMMQTAWYVKKDALPVGLHPALRGSGGRRRRAHGPAGQVGTPTGVR
jgi:Cytochrome bd terminal oxidase subunit I